MLLRLLASPVTAPLRAGWWVVERIVDTAERERHDEQRLVAQLRALAIDAQEGRTSEAEYAAGERRLLHELGEARRRYAATVEDDR